MNEAQMQEPPSDTRPTEQDNEHTPHSGGNPNECAQEEELMGHAVEPRDRQPAVCGKRTRTTAASPDRKETLNKDAAEMVTRKKMWDCPANGHGWGGQRCAE